MEILYTPPPQPSAVLLVRRTLTFRTLLADDIINRRSDPPRTWLRKMLGYWR